MEVVDSLIRQEDSDTEEYEMTESESEEIADSQKSDSDFEMLDEKDSSGSEPKEEVYHRPTTRSSSQHFDQESQESSKGIQTRSKTKRQEANPPEPASRPKAKQEDFDALLLYSLKVPLSPLLSRRTPRSCSPPSRRRRRRR